MQNLIKSYIEGINIGSVQTYRNLDVFPLVSDYKLDLDYLTLDEALNEDAIDVVELDQAGSVPELKVVNKSDTMILILDGEELVGAKQNRIVNTTLLIAGKDYTGHFNLTGSQIGAIIAINGQSGPAPVGLFPPGVEQQRKILHQNDTLIEKKKVPQINYPAASGGL